MSINYKLLAAFMAVAQTGSFRRAAEETHRSIPAVSMQIKRLEEQLGIALFQRTTRKISLTPEGERLMIGGRRAMAELQASLDYIRQAADVQRGHLSVGCVPTISSVYLPRVLAVFSGKYPGMTFSLREMVGETLLESVRRAEVDLAIGPAPKDTAKAEVDIAPVFVDDYCVLLPTEHPAGATVTVAQLAKMPLIAPASSTAFRGHMDEVLKSLGTSVKSRISYEFMGINTLIAMVEAGMGVALLPRSAIPLHTTLKTARVVRPVLSRTIAIMTARGHSLPPAAQRFEALFREAVGSA